MSVVDGLERSSAGRLSLRSLVFLAYLIFIIGTVLGAGLDRLITDFPHDQYVAATIALVAMLLLVNWFFGADLDGNSTERSSDVEA